MARPDRRQARDKRLIQLGARPPPPVATNYKQLTQELVARRAEVAQRRVVLRREGVPKHRLPRPQRKHQAPRNRNKVRGLTSGCGKVRKKPS